MNHWILESTLQNNSWVKTTVKTEMTGYSEINDKGYINNKIYRMQSKLYAEEN